MEKKEIRKIPCPRCRRESPWEGNPFRPFCGEKCQLIDLGRWAQEEYSIPGDPAPEQDVDDQD